MKSDDEKVSEELSTMYKYEYRDVDQLCEDQSEFDRSCKKIDEGKITINLDEEESEISIYESELSFDGDCSNCMVIFFVILFLIYVMFCYTG